MRTDGEIGRFLREERGFTVAEMTVTMVIWTLALVALFSIFDMSLKVFSFGNNNAEAMESARLGLEKMEREVRQAYAVDRANDDTRLLLETFPTRITFGNDLDGNRKIECPDDENCEYITYKLTDDADGSSAACAAYPCDLRRVNTGNSSDPGDPVVENVVVNGLAFTYQQSDGSAPADESEIGKVLVSLETAVKPASENRATQRLTTEIDLRNR